MEEHAPDQLAMELGALQGDSLDQLVQDGINHVLGGSQGSMLPLEPLPEGDHGGLPMVDPHPTLQLSGLDLPPLGGHAGGEHDVASQVRDTNCTAPRHPYVVAPVSAPISEDEVDQDDEEDEEEDEAVAAAAEGNETGSSGRPGRGTKRKKPGKAGKRPNAPSMQGRFSGRLGTKEDEKRLAAECRLIGPMLGGASRGEKSLHTLAKLVRAIAAGSVRAHLESIETERQDLRAKLLLLSDGDGQQLARLQEDNAELRRELAAQEHVMAELELKLQRAGIPTGGLGGLGSMALDAGMQRVTSMGLQAPAQQGSMGLPLTCGALPTLVSMPSQQQQQQQQQQLLQAPQVALAPQLAPGLTAAPMATATLGAVAQPTMSAADAVAQQQQQQMQVLAGMQTAAQVVVSMAPQAPAPPVQQVMLQAGNGLQAMAQPAATSMSSGALAAAAAAVHPALPARSGDALSGEAGMHAGLMQGTQPAHSGPTDPGAAVADAAAQNLNQQAQQLTVQATLHEQAKSAATSQAQQLASQAQLHAQASVQAAVQAEQLKQTLSVLPDNQQAQQAVATVQNLEERAKAHADITTQAVAQARELQEKAHAHAAEQAKAMAQANVLQAHAHSLAASAQQIEAVQQATSGQPAPALTAISGEQGMVLQALPPVVVAPPQPTASVTRTEGAVDLSALLPTTPTDLAAQQAQQAQQLQQAAMAAAQPQAPVAAVQAQLQPTMVPAQLPDGTTVQVLVQQPTMVTQASNSMPLGPPPAPLQPQQAVLPTVGSLAGAGSLPMAPSGDSVAMQQASAAVQTAQLQEHLAVMHQVQAQQQAVVAAQQHQEAAVAVHAAQQQAAAAQQQLQAAVATQHHFHHQAIAAEQQLQQHQAVVMAAQEATVTAHHHSVVQSMQQEPVQPAQSAFEQLQAAQGQLNLAAAVAQQHQHQAKQANQAHAQAQAHVQQAQASAAAAQQPQTVTVTVQSMPQGLPAPQLVQAVNAAAHQACDAMAAQQPPPPQQQQPPLQPAAASAILQPTPPSAGKPQSLTVKLEPLGSAASLPASSGNALMDSQGGSGGLRPMATAGGSGGAGSLPMGPPSLSTGLTPQVGGLELPPGMEDILPSDQPLTGDPASLQAAAAMGPVISIPPSASDGLAVASGSTA